MDDVIDFRQLKKNLKKDFTGHSPVKMAVLSEEASQLLVVAIRGYGYELGLDIRIHEAEYNQVSRQLLDPSSDVYGFEPEFICVFLSSSHSLKPSWLLMRCQRVRLQPSTRSSYQVRVRRKRSLHCARSWADGVEAIPPGIM